MHLTLCKDIFVHIVLHMHGLPNNGHVKANKGRLTAILNLIESNFFQNASTPETSHSAL